MNDCGASPLGYHFLNDWQNCRRRWFFKNILRLEPDDTKTVLSLGKWIHEAREAYYKGGREARLLVGTFENLASKYRLAYEEERKFTEDFNIGHGLLDTWLKVWHENDLTKYEVLDVESDYEVKVREAVGGRGEYLTIRPDLVMRDVVTHETYVFDCKTTGWSVGQAFHDMDCGDQATAYIWGLRQVHPEWNVQGMIVDILYHRGSKREAARPGIIYRTKADLERFETGALGLVNEIAQHVAALEAGEPEARLFPRNGATCAKWGCPYEEYCRSEIKPGDIPLGLHRKES